MPAVKPAFFLRVFEIQPTPDAVPPVAGADVLAKGAGLSGFQFRIPIQIIEPAFVQKVGRERTSVAVQFKHRRSVWPLRRVHADICRQVIALLQIARCAGRYDVVPSGQAAAGTRDQVVKRQVFLGTAVLARETVAQEHVETRESGIKCRLHVGLERDDAWQLHLEVRTADTAVVLRDDVDPVKKYRLHRLLPAPERQRIVAQGPEIGVQDQGRKRFRHGSMGVHCAHP